MNFKTDSKGMVRYCIDYRSGERSGELTEMAQIHEVLQQPDAFVWMALHEPDDPLMQLVQQEFDLHELAVEDARRAHQRPKLDHYGHSLFIVVKTAMLWEGQVQLGETHMFVGPRFFLTVRHGPSVTYASVRERLETTPEYLAKGPAMAAYGVLDFVVDNYAPLVDTMQQQFEQLEQEIFKGKFNRQTIERLYDLKRELLTLRGAAAPVLDIAGELMRFHDDLIPKDVRAYFRDVHDHVVRLLATTDEMREMLISATQVNLAFISVEQNDAVRRLAGWGAILAIPTVVFSLYGMNFKEMPELSLHNAYPVVVSVTALSCIWLYRRLKRFGWL
jgi:magnesium transporter